MTLIERLVSWGPVFFGVCIFGPMWAAVLDAAHIDFGLGVTNLTLTLVVGVVWGYLALRRGRWL